ncbi:MAG: hypothetical protein EOM85_02735 [Candidatus Moranbacteria bacterium]|nr:hypothetical protein [Candidatus Moranbacteria bacterium]
MYNMSNKHKLEKHFSWQFRLVEYLAYFLAFSTPIYFNTKHFYAFNSPKVLLILTIVLSSLVFFLWGKWKEDGFKIKISLLGIATTILGLALTISSFLGVDPINSFFGWGNVVPLVAIYALIVFAFILGSLIRKNSKIIPRILLSFFISSILVVAYFYIGLPEPIGKTEGSTLGNSSHVGGFLVFAVSFGIALLFYLKKWWQKILVILGLLFITVNPLFINKEFLLGNIGFGKVVDSPFSLLGIANGATMGIGLSIIFAGILFMVFAKKKIFKILGLVLAIVLISGISYTSMALVKEGTKINKIFTEQKTANRFVAWDIAKDGYKDNPVWGNGVNNYIYNFEKYYNPVLYEKEYVVEKLLEPHNVVWQFASDSGFIGLASYLLLLVGLFITLLYRRTNENLASDTRLRNVRIILAATILGHFVHNLFVFDTSTSYLCLFAVIGIGLGVGEVWQIDLSRFKNIYIWLKRFSIILLIALSLFLLGNLCYGGLSESKAMLGIIGETKNMSDFAKRREGVSEKSPFGGVMEYTYQSERLVKLYQRILYQVDDSNKKVFLNEIKSMVSNLEEVVAKQPNYGVSYLTMSGALNLYMLAESKEGTFIKLNKNSYDREIWDKSFKYANKSIEINKNNPINYNVLSQLYMIKGDMDSAYSYAKKYIDLAPEYEEAYTFGRGLLKIRGNPEFEKYLNEMEQKYLN